MLFTRNPYAAYVRIENINGERFIMIDMRCHGTIIQTLISLNQLNDICSVMHVDIKKEISRISPKYCVYLHPSLKQIPVKLNEKDKQALEIEVGKELDVFVERMKLFSKK